MKAEEIMKLGKKVGFDQISVLDPKTIRVRAEVRDMCAANKCHLYGKNWSCPPGCGSLEDCERKIKDFQSGILVQTVKALEDEWDVEGMMAADEEQKEKFLRLKALLMETYDSGMTTRPWMLPLANGGCHVCKECTYPEAPCRMPEKSISSMEAYGMVVSDVCQANHMQYYYGGNTIAYTGCFLFAFGLS